MTRAGAVSVLFGGLLLWSAVGDAWVGLRNFDRLAPLGPGKAAPSFTVELLDGGRFSSADLLGKVSIVTFWATWCPYCRDELEILDAMRDDARFEQVQIVAVNREQAPLEQARALSRSYRDAKAMSLAIAIDDGQMARSFGVGPIPHTAIFDRNGQLRHVHQGRVSGETLRAQVDVLLATPVATP